MTEPWNPWWAGHYAEYSRGAELLGQQPLDWASYQRARDGTDPSLILDAERAAQIWSALDCVPARGYAHDVWWHPVAGEPPAVAPPLPVRVSVSGPEEQFPIFERWLRAGWTIIWLGDPCPAAAALAADFGSQFHWRSSAPESLPRVLAELREILRDGERVWAAAAAAPLRAQLERVRRDLDTYSDAVRHRAIQLGHDPRAGRFTRPLSDVEIAEVRGWDKPRADYLHQIAQLESDLADWHVKQERAQDGLETVKCEQQLRQDQRASAGAGAAATAAADRAEYARLMAADATARALAELDKGLADRRGTEAARLHAVAPRYLQRRFHWISAARAEIARHTPQLRAETFLAWLGTNLDAQLDCVVVDHAPLARLTWNGSPLLAALSCAERRLARALNLLRAGAALDEVCAAAGVDVTRR